MVPVHSAWFIPEFVVYAVRTVAYSRCSVLCLHRDMTEKELYLFKFSAGGVAKPRARSPKVVG